MMRAQKGDAGRLPLELGLLNSGQRAVFDSQKSIERPPGHFAGAMPVERMFALFPQTVADQRAHPPQHQARSLPPPLARNQGFGDVRDPAPRQLRIQSRIHTSRQSAQTSPQASVPHVHSAGVEFAQHAGLVESHPHVLYVTVMGNAAQQEPHQETGAAKREVNGRDGKLESYSKYCLRRRTRFSTSIHEAAAARYVSRILTSKPNMP